MNLEKAQREFPPKAYEMLKEAWLDSEEKTRRITELESANIKLTAELLERTSRIEVAEEMAFGVLRKSVDKYLNL